MIKLRQGTCCKCERSGKIIAKTIPSSGDWCHLCNDERLEKEKPAEKHPRTKNRLLGTRAVERAVKPVKELIKDLDRAFSVWRRKLDADANGNTKCVTCGTPGPWQSFDLGHCFPRGNWAIRWDHRNCGPQCRECNSHPDGQREKYKLYIESTYGSGTVELLEALRNAPHKLNPIELKELIKKYSS